MMSLWGVTADESAGYARKVIAINGSVYTTIAVPLNQVFPDAELNLDINIFNDTIAANSSVKGSDGRLQSLSSAVDILNFNRTLQHEIVPGVKTVAELKMKSVLNVNVGVNIFSGTITNLSTIVSANYSTTNYLDVNLTEKYSKSIMKEFKPIFDKSKVIFISGFPVLVNVKAVPVVGAGINLSAAGTLKYGFKVGGAVRAGFEYANNSITNIAEFNPYMNKIGPDYTLAGGLKMNAQASIAVIVTLYDINVDIPVLGKIEFSGPGLGVDLGPYANFKVDAKYDSQANPKLTCALDLSVGINSDLSIDYGTLGSQLNVSNPKNINLYNLNKSLWNADVCPFGTTLGNLTGTVTGSSGAVLSNVSVQVSNDAGQVVAGTTTMSTGQYQIDEIAVGSYVVLYSKQEYKTARAALLITANETTNIPVVMVQKEIDGEQQGILNLSVVKANAPSTLLTGANVVIREGLDNPTGDVIEIVKSTATAIEIPLDAGYYTLVVEKPDYWPATISKSIEATTVHDISIPLTKIVISKYIKLDSFGATLPSNATSWSCVRDSSTGLVWEVKTYTRGIHYFLRGNRWGGQGAVDIGVHPNPDVILAYPDWDEIVDGSNSEQLCGSAGWRVPSITELESLVDRSRTNPSANIDYFPRTVSQHFWSINGTSDPHDVTAWALNTNDGSSYHSARVFYNVVRVVHD